jgi:hypothetical protein
MLELEQIDPVGQFPHVEVDQRPHGAPRKRVLPRHFLQLLCALCDLCGE